MQASGKLRAGERGVSRRDLIKAAGLAPLAGLLRAAPAAAQAGPAPLPPVIFVHGNGDHAAIWMTVIWRFESNLYPSDRLFAFNFTDPNARAKDEEPQPGRSSSADQLRELAAWVESVKAQTGEKKVALVCSSRGGYAARNYVADPANAANVSHVVLCGVPNHGVFDWEFSPGSEFNGRGALLKRLNGGDSETVPGPAFLTLRSDGNDKFAQTDAKVFGKPGVPSGVSPEGPALKGALNLVLGQLDHRETAFHPRAFREIWKFITGAEPSRIAVAAEPEVTLDGLVTGNPGNSATNRPVADAAVEVHRVSAETGERIGDPLHRRITGEDGRWGPVAAEEDWSLEFVISAPGSPATHIYRSPFARSTQYLHLRPGRALDKSDAGAGSVVMMTRPRGYFCLPRDTVLLDGREPSDVRAGVAVDDTAVLRLPTAEINRAVVAEFNEERIVARAWPVAENRIVICELTY